MRWWMPEICPGEKALRSLIGATTVLVANWLVGGVAFEKARFERDSGGVPMLRIHRGQLTAENLWRETTTKEELLPNLRSQRIFDLHECCAVAIEPSGKLGLMKEEGPRTPEPTR